MSALFLVVVITVKWMNPAVCTYPRPLLVSQPDGTYYQSPTTMTTLQVCYSYGTRREEWTDPPESGGSFIRIVDEQVNGEGK